MRLTAHGYSSISEQKTLVAEPASYRQNIPRLRRQRIRRGHNAPLTHRNYLPYHSAHTAYFGKQPCTCAMTRRPAPFQRTLGDASQSRLRRSNRAPGAQKAACGRTSGVVTTLIPTDLCYMPSSPPENWLKASGAASSKRVRRLRKTNLTLSVWPLRCLAIMMSAMSRSSGVRSIFPQFGR